MKALVERVEGGGKIDTSTNPEDPFIGAVT